MTMLKGDNRGALCSADAVLYEIYMFRGHVFRVYPGGRISKADEQDAEFATMFGKRV